MRSSISAEEVIARRSASSRGWEKKLRGHSFRAHDVDLGESRLLGGDGLIELCLSERQLILQLSAARPTPFGALADRHVVATQAIDTPSCDPADTVK
jgi:hypothetical protein